VSLHHAVQSAGFDLFLQPDLVEARVIQREAVTETNTGEVPWLVTTNAKNIVTVAMTLRIINS